MLAIHKKMSAIMADVEPIAKDKENKAQGYKFRGIDQVYAALQAIMAKHGVFTTSEIMSERTEDRTSAKGAVLIYRVLGLRYNFWAEDGSSCATEVIGEGMDSGDKASNKAMSVAHKYALLQAFMIPTEDPKDPEQESHDLAADGPELYRGTEEQLTRLKRVLTGLGVDQPLWVEISSRLIGKPCTIEQIRAIIPKLENQVGVKA